MLMGVLGICGSFYSDVEFEISTAVAAAALWKSCACAAGTKRVSVDQTQASRCYE